MKDEFIFRLGLGLFGVAVGVLWARIYPIIGICFFAVGVAMILWSFYIEDDED